MLWSVQFARCECERRLKLRASKLNFMRPTRRDAPSSRPHVSSSAADVYPATSDLNGRAGVSSWAGGGHLARGPGRRRRRRRRRRPCRQLSNGDTESRTDRTTRSRSSHARRGPRRGGAATGLVMDRRAELTPPTVDRLSNRANVKRTSDVV